MDVELLRPEDKSADGEENEATKAQPRAIRHAKRSTRILKDWFISHAQYPYPSEEEKEVLAEKTGLTTRQISFWFVNARRRKNAPRSTLAISTTPSSLPADGQLPGSAWDNMTPLDRWRHTPPDQDGASLSAITQAAECGTYASSAPGLVSYGFGTRELFPEPESSISSFGSYHIPTSAPSSDLSALSQSSGSASSSYSHSGFRRRRRRQRPPLKSSSKRGSARPYQCTFCTDTFSTRYDWTRHEGTLHLVLERWTCLPSGPTYRDPAQRLRCALCDLLEPSTSHLGSHAYAACMSKSIGCRIFYRKDHLKQHLRVSHGVNEVLPSMESWKSHISRIKSRCGFCDESFSLWSDRNDHLADHFRLGALMKDWKGCRGLEPAVALLVENAMPPYLIGMESNDLQPFSASKTTAKASSSGVASGLAPRTTFEMLTARLGDCVKAAKESDIVVTDDFLRREARLILFGDDDPWNQTPADNVEWLALFKKGYGLSDSGACTDRTELTFLTCQNYGLDQSHGMNTSPFTPEKMRQAALSTSSFGPGENCGALLYSQISGEEGSSDLAVPWSWQTPECLAEFSQMRETEQIATVDTVDHFDFDMIFSTGFDDEQDPTMGPLYAETRNGS